MTRIIYKKEKGKKVSYKSKRCGYCKKPFLARVDKSKRRKFCSLECIYKSRIGRPRLEKYFTPKELETRRKLSKFGVTFKDE